MFISRQELFEVWRTKNSLPDKNNATLALFKNYEVASEVTGIDIELIKRLGTILQASGYSINIERFKHRLNFFKSVDLRHIQEQPYIYISNYIHGIICHQVCISFYFIEKI